jgi:hypothetical protein
MIKILEKIGHLVFLLLLVCAGILGVMTAVWLCAFIVYLCKTLLLMLGISL